MPAEAKARILLVDDQPANLLALQAVLEELGQELVLAASGEDALRRLLDDDFAVILMDVKMPGLNGMDTAALIRERQRSQHTPIIFLTAYQSSEVELFQGYSLGAVDYLCKPIQPEVLRSKVSVFVDLYWKTEQVRQQAEQLRANERREHERALAEERQRWEMEHLRAEAAREKKNAEELGLADRRKDEFLALLAHELRNPLAPIMNALHLLRLQAEEPAKIAEISAIVQRQVNHMARLIDDLLDVSRINQGRIQLRREPVTLAEAAAHAVESVTPLMQTRGHELTVALPPQPVWLLADPTRLEQILANLLNNAAKYTEPGGHIWLTVTEDENEAQIRIRDTGLGIPPDMLECIFEMFTQVDRSLSSPSQWGLGIGLGLVRSLVQLHGGSVQASSAGLGQGSEFVVRLPRLTEAPATLTASPATVEISAGSTARILVVDDNPDATASLALLLRLEGHEVFTAQDGEEALAMVQLHRPEVVLLDIGLPKLNGFEVAGRLRQSKESRDLFLLAMTGYGQEEDRRRGLQVGFDAYLVKPVNLADIQRLLYSRPARVPALPTPTDIAVEHC